MQYGICHLSITPVRVSADHTSEMTTQLLYGDHFKVLEHRKDWSRIRIAYDQYEGWVDNKQFTLVSAEAYGELDMARPTKIATDLVSFCSTGNNVLIPVVLGSSLQHLSLLDHTYEGKSVSGIQEKDKLIDTALLFLNAPYLWGGKTPFGIDCSGLAQMVYKINGHTLARNAAQQAGQGEALSFIEESEAGDLVFFDNSEGIIDHVGLVMKNNYVIHAHGKVRIDRLDHTGIFNTETGRYTHKLRVIKKII
ncbi:C40 family peptidase [Flavobacteriaceae bacterium 3-367]|uniref:C40 family peptidase n=1 Tax=Eudoraea algarum TaxID=3417568 RepID=UPI003270CE48